MITHASIGELFSIRKGKKMREVAANDNTDAKVRYIQIEDLRGNGHLRYCEDQEDAVIVSSDDIVIAWDGANAGISSFGLEGAIGTTLARLSPKGGDLYTPYVGAFVKHSEPFLRATCTGATIPHVHRQSLEGLVVPLPSLEVQRKIADTLDKAETLIDKRKQQIELLDELLKSVFLDMFGDPFSNSKGWGVVPLGNLAKLEGGFAFRSIDYTGKGIRLVRIANVHYEHLDWGDVCFLPSSYEEEYKHYSLSAGDILIAMTRPIIKSLDSVKVARVRDSDLPCLLNQRVGRFKILDKRLVDEYLYQFCLSSYVKNFVEKFSSVSLQPNISSKQIEAIPIPLPPRDSQLKFRDVFYSVVAQQESMRKSLAYMGDNFNSIMQRAFKGELFS